MNIQKFRIINPVVGKACIDHIRKAFMDRSKDPNLPVPVVTVGPEKRSNPQNNMMWAIHSQYCAYVQFTTGVKMKPQEWHYMFFIELFMPIKGQITVTDKDGNQTMRPIYKTSSELDKAEFSEIIEKYIAYCIERGLEIDL